MHLVFFTDFDGTITEQDTCMAMAEAFARGNWQELELQWQKGELTTEECARETLKLFDAGEEELRKLLTDHVTIDSHFIPFAQFCRQKGHEIYVLSDGYDYNIETVFDKYGIKDIPYFANRLIIKGRKFDIECIHSSRECPRCGTCKAELMEKLKPEGALAVYIGDGYSDLCAAKKADVIFAKGVLLSHLCREGIPAMAFDDFSDILKWLNRR